MNLKTLGTFRHPCRNSHSLIDVVEAIDGGYLHSSGSEYDSEHDTGIEFCARSLGLPSDTLRRLAASRL